MNNLDDVPWLPSDHQDETRPEREPRKCRRHQWIIDYDQDHPDSRVLAAVGWKCRRCGKLKDEARSRRGKSSARLGKDQERRIERVYGPRKVGEFGDAVDHVGRDFKWQSKASRGLPPAWLAKVETNEHRDIVPKSVLNPMAHMTGLYPTLMPLVIRSYVRAGVRTRDWLFVTVAAWVRLHGERGPFEPYAFGRPVRGPLPLGYLVMSGEYFLSVHGRDGAALATIEQALGREEK